MRGEEIQAELAKGWSAAAIWKVLINQKQGNNLQRDYPYPDLLRAFEVSVEGLESTDRERYLDLALFPEDQPVPESALSVLWKRREKDLSC